MAKRIIKNNKVYPYLLKHNEFAKNFIFNSLGETQYRFFKHNMTLGKRIEDDIVLLDKSELKFSSSGVILHPEFLPYLFEVKGNCPQKLFFYLLFNVVNKTTCRFPFNDHIGHEFIDYCKGVNSLPIYKLGGVKRAIRAIVAANLIISTGRKKYMLNPLIISTNKRARWSLINTYIQELEKKNLAIDRYLFPKYGRLINI